MVSRVIFFAAVCISLLCAADEAHAESPPAVRVSAPDAAQADDLATAALRVGYSPIVPFVSDTELAGAPRGFEVDVIDAVAARMGRSVTWVKVANVKDNLEQVVRGDVDIAVGGISVTRSREDVVDFTYPVVRNGQAIVVLAASRESGVFDRLFTVLNGGRLGALLGFVLLLVVAGHLVWLAERGSPSFDDRYIPGVFEGIYWAIVTASTVGYGDKAPVRWAGRVVAGLVIVVSLPMFAIFTAELASAITIEAVTRGAINGPRDLDGRAVAVLQGTTGAEWAKAQGARVQVVNDLDEAIKKLRSKAVMAVVYDAPPLKVMVQEQADLASLPGTFDPLDVGFAVAENDDLREQLNRQLLTLREQGSIEEFRHTWFGD